MNNENNRNNISSEDEKFIIRQRRTRVYSVFTTIIAVIALTAATLAWFASNRQLESTGMVMKAKATQSLVIEQTPEALFALDNGDYSYEVDLSDVYEVIEPIIPCRHQDDDFTGDTPSLLYYNTNPESVSLSDGLAANPLIPLTFAAVPEYTEGDGDRYYLDYEVYIASLGDDLIGQDLFAVIDGYSQTSATLPETFNACSIDFYVGDDPSYAATLNLAGYEWKSNDQTAFTNAKLADNVTIPFNKTEEGTPYIKVTMRCYFDGGLLSSSTHTFVNSETVDINTIALNVRFMAAEHTEATP